MSLQFYTLKVKDIRKETVDCVSIAFEIPRELEKLFTFKQGQNITIKKEFNNTQIRRTYSICSSPLDQELRIAVKKIPNGLFSNYANTILQIGDALEIMTPTGKFHKELSADNENSYMAFAAGSGITPIISIIKTTLQIEKKSSFTLVYGNKNMSSKVVSYNYLDKAALVAPDK